MVQICLGGLTPRFDTMRTVVLARENPPSLFDLQSMLLVEENHVRTKSNASEGHMLYTHSDKGRGHSRARRGQFSLGRGGQGLTYENNSQIWQENGNNRGTFRRRGSFHAEPSRQNNPSNANTVEKLATMKRSVKGRRVSPRLQADNSPSMPRTPTMMTMEECST